MNCDIVTTELAGGLFEHKCQVCGYSRTTVSNRVTRICGVAVKKRDPAKPAPKGKRQSDIPCAHRGERIRTERCQLCGERDKPVTVYACNCPAVPQQVCTLRGWESYRKPTSPAICLICPHRG